MLPRGRPKGAHFAVFDLQVSCLPAFYLLGEMKCGTTTMYKKLASHPHVVLPRNKEVR